MIHRLLNEERGYSLIEVMASIIIMGIAILPMIAMFDTGLNSATTGSNYDKARMLANANIEKVQSLSYLSARTTYKPLNADPPGGPVPCDESMLSLAEQNRFDCEIETTYMDLENGDYVPDPSATIQMRVVVTVEWDDNNYTTTGLKAR